jgi:pyrroline-5-carboxylate reductase
MKIAFIGGGNMGEAMISILLDQRLALPQDISVSDIDESRRQHLQEKYRVGVSGDNQLTITRAEIVVLAIKPQNLAAVIAELKGWQRPTQLVLSIVAGATLQALSSGLNHHCVVRAIPNTPAQIGQGITVWTATPQVTEQQKERAGSILRTLGKEIYVEDEKYVDMATAISGSGPAYFFLFVELLVAAARYIGLPQDMAEELVLQTMLGSGHLIQKSDKTPAELRRMVTSPGGTTAEALLVFEKGELANLIKQAVNAAYDKARKLSGEQR